VEMVTGSFDSVKTQIKLVFNWYVYEIDEWLESRLDTKKKILFGFYTCWKLCKNGECI